jgi:hypothetical protein
MVAALRRSLVLGVVVLGWMGLVAGVGFGSQCGGSGRQDSAVTADGAKTNEAERPLPDIPALMHSVEANQRISEAIEKDYLYTSVVKELESDRHGGVKKTETREFDVFWVNGVQVRRMTKKDGKELSAEEQSERVDKEAAKAKERRAKADEKGKETDPHGNEEITASRILELGNFTNARRVELNGRDTIEVDYAGDPRAKTRNRSEEVIRDLVGTVWVDEKDRVLSAAEGHFLNAFKIGGGLVVDVQKGTSFSMQMKKVNDEVWLPATWQGEGALRALLFVSINGSVQGVDSNYRKFTATSTVLPGASTVEDDSVPK